MVSFANRRPEYPWNTVISRISGLDTVTSGGGGSTKVFFSEHPAAMNPRVITIVNEEALNFMIFPGD
jgi:hypothetical protein